MFVPEVPDFQATPFLVTAQLVADEVLQDRVTDPPERARAGTTVKVSIVGVITTQFTFW